MLRHLVCLLLGFATALAVAQDPTPASVTPAHPRKTPATVVTQMPSAAPCADRAPDPRAELHQLLDDAQRDAARLEGEADLIAGRPVPWPEELEWELTPEGVQAYADELEAVDGVFVLEVDCDEFPCIVMTGTWNGWEWMKEFHSDENVANSLSRRQRVGRGPKAIRTQAMIRHDLEDPFEKRRQNLRIERIASRNYMRVHRMETPGEP